MTAYAQLYRLVQVRWIRRLVALPIVVLLLTPSQLTPSQLTPSQLTPSHGQAQSAEPITVRVMSFNIWVGGELVNFAKVVAAIQAAEADIVGLQEATGNTRRLADALGWYANERTQIISRFPLIDPPESAGVYLFAQVAPGEVVAVANVHLPSGPYGPEAVRDGATLAEVIELEETTRLPMIAPSLPTLTALAATGMPVFLTGDFNTPSHRDWPEALIGSRTGLVYSVPWPVTAAVEDAGFVDTYRAAYPDPTQRLGITWSYGYPYPRLKVDEVIDRIDFVFAAGAGEVLASEIVGPAGSPEVDIAIAPFPSDHRGVVSTVTVTPHKPPYLVATDKRVVKQGETFVVRYFAPNGEAQDRIAVVAAGDDATTDALMWLPPYEASFSGSVTFGSGTLTPGLYEVVLLGEDHDEVARNAFWVVAPTAQPTLQTAQPSFTVGEPITVTWDNAPAQRWDWLAIYSAGDPDLYNGYWGYLYTKATVAGSATFGHETLGEELLPPGDYTARLLLDDGYAVLAEADFTITE